MKPFIDHAQLWLGTTRGIALLGCVLAIALPESRAQKFDDPKARAALPEFKVIPAAKPDELTPAAEVDLAQFSRWPRSHGDNGARRYSTLKQITRQNVANLGVAWTYHSKDASRGQGEAGNIECTPIIV